MKPKLVIFDCDGVLVDSESIGNQFIAKALTEAGIPMSAEGALDEFLGGKLTQIKIDAELKLRRVLPSDWVEKIYEKQFLEFQRNLKTINGIEKVLDVLYENGVQICVGSNGPPNKMEVSLGVTGLKTRFEGRIFSADHVTKPKPEPDLYLFCAKQMNVEIQNCLVIEDSPRGAMAGIAAGMTVFGYAGSTNSSSLMDVGCAKVFGTMEELAEYFRRLY